MFQSTAKHKFQNVVIAANVVHDPSALTHSMQAGLVFNIIGS
jgi:hypothetical protein